MRANWPIHSVRFHLALGFALTCSSFGAPAKAEIPLQPAPAVFDLDQGRELCVPIDGLWRFQVGDDIDGAKGWASPSFDDSHWPVIHANRSWSEQGFKDLGGSAWYRAKLRIPAGSGQLALMVPAIRGSYQIFADGALIATQGGLPPHPYPVTMALRVVSIPSLSPQSRTLQLAIRVWNWPHHAMYNHGGILRSNGAGILVGDAQLIAARASAYRDSIEWQDSAEDFLSVFGFLAAAASLLLYLFGGREPEYLWFGLFLLADVAVRQFGTYRHFRAIRVLPRELLNDGFLNLRRLTQVLFINHLLAGKRDRLFWAAIGAVAGIAIVTCLGNLPSGSPLISVAMWLSLEQSFDFVVCCWLVNIVIRRALQGDADARLLLAPVLLRQLLWTVDGVFEIAYRFGWIHSLPGWISFSIQWPFPLGIYDIVDLLFLAAMLAILLYRFTRTRRMEDSHHREREAARTIQQVLVVDKMPVTPGFSIHSVYKPFGEVGGDFFQVLSVAEGPHAGSVLVIIGDVSGKGLPAAMTVSLLVGTVRTLAHYTQSPRDILIAMNERMAGRNSGGFTTCLVLRAESNGVITIANAGHIAPYLDGAELLLENGFPLGLIQRADYPESTFHLPFSAQLTLITDGVVEARSPSGELYGFDRTRTISVQSAEDIVQTVMSYGQDDDITALTLMREPLPAT
jgi:Stage II sporulation protein E (SpoIIE)/7TM diverse intracellular signalling